METIEGVVESVSQKGKRYSVMINREWYGAYGDCPVNKGDIVRIGWKQGGEKEKGGFFRDIVKVEKIALPRADTLAPAKDMEEEMKDCFVATAKWLVPIIRTNAPKASDDVIVTEIGRWGVTRYLSRKGR